MKYRIATVYTRKCLTLFAASLLIILSPSCKDKCNEYYLGSLVNMNPYTGNETLVFDNSNGDDILFIGQGRNVSINTVQPQNSGEDCDKTEFDDCYFGEEDELFQLKINLRPTTNAYQAHLDLTLIDYRYNDTRPFRYHFSFNLPLNKYTLSIDQFFYDSLLIHSTMQYDIFASNPRDNKSIPTREISLDTIHPSMIFYNIHNGLLKIDFDDGSTWELKEIIP